MSLKGGAGTTACPPKARRVTVRPHRVDVDGRVVSRRASASAAHTCRRGRPDPCSLISRLEVSGDRTARAMSKATSASRPSHRRRLADERVDEDARHGQPLPDVDGPDPGQAGIDRGGAAYDVEERRGAQVETSAVPTTWRRIRLRGPDRRAGGDESAVTATPVRRGPPATGCAAALLVRPLPALPPFWSAWPSDRWLPSVRARSS